MSSTALAGAVKNFEKNVFVNCPFDAKYLRLLRPLLFTVAILGYLPRIAAERSDSGENRLDKICELIRQSKFSIHDLSRLKAARASELYRMNMPFELGIDYGSRQHGPEFLRSKKYLILGRELHDFKKALSDLSGVDIRGSRKEEEGYQEARLSCHEIIIAVCSTLRIGTPEARGGKRAAGSASYLLDSASSARLRS